MNGTRAETDSGFDSQASQVHLRSAAWGVVRLYAWLGSMFGFTWLSSMFLHEMGHILCGWYIGGGFRFIDVYPFRFSTTIVEPNPHPSLVIWSGLLFGWSVPLMTIPFWRIGWASIGDTLQSWSAYCWLAFGTYLALAAGESLSDTGQLMTEGWSLGMLITTGASVAAGGYLTGRPAIKRLHARFAKMPPSWKAVGAVTFMFVGWCTAQWFIAESLWVGTR